MMQELIAVLFAFAVASGAYAQSVPANSNQSPGKGPGATSPKVQIFGKSGSGFQTFGMGSEDATSDAQTFGSQSYGRSSATGKASSAATANNQSKASDSAETAWDTHRFGNRTYS